MYIYNNGIISNELQRLALNSLLDGCDLNMAGDIFLPLNATLKHWVSLSPLHYTCMCTVGTVYVCLLHYIATVSAYG